MLAIILTYFIIFSIATITCGVELAYAVAVPCVLCGGGGTTVSSNTVPSAVPPPTSVSDPIVSPSPVLYGSTATLTVGIANPPLSYKTYVFYCSGASCIPSTSSPVLGSGSDSSGDTSYSFTLCSTPNSASCLPAGKYNALFCIGYYAISICGNPVSFKVINPNVSIQGISPVSPIQGYQYAVAGSISNPPGSFTTSLYYCSGNGCVPTTGSQVLAQKSQSGATSFTFQLCQSSTQSTCLASGAYSLLPCISYSGGTSVCGSPYPLVITSVSAPTISCTSKGSACTTLAYPASVSISATCQVTTSSGICEIFQLGYSNAVCSAGTSLSSRSAATIGGGGGSPACSCTSSSTSISCNYSISGQQPGSYSYIAEYTGTGQISSPVSYNVTNT